MRRYLLKAAILFLMIFATALPSLAQFRYFSDYMYITNHEMTRFEEVVWFWTPDTLYASMHSNSSIGIKYGPSFMGLVTTSEDEFIYFAANPYFEYSPIFNWPRAVFPEEITALREEAGNQEHFYENEDDNLQFRCQATEDGWQWWSWNADSTWDSTMTVDDGLVEYGDENVLFFEGQLQLFGDQVDGQTTIGSSGDIYLVDNLIYSSFDIDELPDTFNVDERLGVVAESEIFIADTWRNGRGNGMYEPNRHDRKHIVVTAALLALDERITFEHQNDEGDDYVWCDPDGEHYGESDERGMFFLRGSMGMNRKGYLHRSNCGGTGYGKDFYYDFGLLESPPPYFPEIEWDRAIFSDRVWSDTSITLVENEDPITIVMGTLTLEENVNIEVEGRRTEPLFDLIGAELYIYANAENPVSIKLDTAFSRDPYSFIHQNTDLPGYIDAFRPPPRRWSGLEIEGYNYELDIPFEVTDSIFKGGYIYFNAPERIDGDSTSIVNFDQCVLDAFRLYCVGDNMSLWGDLKSSLVFGRLLSRFQLIDRVTFGPSYQVSVQNVREDATIQNSFFLGNHEQLVTGSSASVDYCGYDNFYGDDPFGENIEVGDNILVDENPMFVNPDSNDYHLTSESPLIDAGDPDSEPDPDGSVTDIGAFPYFQTPVKDSDKLKNLPSQITISEIYPNPFNSTTIIQLELPSASWATLTVVDILGREVKTVMKDFLAGGNYNIPLNLEGSAAGIYFIKLETPGLTITRKALLIR
ncbi:MAG: T9SS type A sorting domain-containing protein [Candidatus Electryonea clarkiae]|nr:T9SS type A sorting domain-containing protein [Candidatus Electryonea clarkiae]MDP8287487.1 T9SS type A sorting domain-containing protein [Candidatus Electryonea clarkiae]